MDISKILEIGKDYIGDYVNMIFTVFTNPRCLHEETVKNYNKETQNSLLIVPPGAHLGKRLKKFPPQLMVNFFISIFIGSSLHRLNLSFNASADLINWIILVLLFWVMYLLVVFALFKLLKGRLNLLDFMAVCLQIIASAYIASSFISLLSSMFLSIFTSSLQEKPKIGLPS